MNEGKKIYSRTVSHINRERDQRLMDETEKYPHRYRESPNRYPGVGRRIR